MKQPSFFFKGLLFLLSFLIFQSVQSQDLRFGLNGNIGTNKSVQVPSGLGYEFFNRFSSSLGFTLEEPI